MPDADTSVKTKKVQKKDDKKADSVEKIAAPTQDSRQKKKPKRKLGPCKLPCFPVPISVPDPATAQQVLHPRKDVFVLKVARIGVSGERQSKLELELVTPTRFVKRLPGRVDTKGCQFEEPCKCCCCRCPCNCC